MCRKHNALVTPVVDEAFILNYNEGIVHSIGLYSPILQFRLIYVGECIY